MYLLKALKQNIIDHNLIPEDALVIVGFSGGRDSVALLFALNELSAKLKFKLVAAHFNHGIRGAEADEDEKFAKDFCNELKVVFHSEKIDVPALAKGDNLEAVARDCRYSWLNQLALDYEEDYKKVILATAHHLEDQGETVLLNILRGSGTQGMGGMKWKNGNLIRPFLNIPRVEIENYIEEKNLDYRDDSTNFHTDYKRNSIRLELWPQLMKYNDNINVALGNLADICNYESDFMDKYTETKITELVEENDFGYVIKRADLESLDIAIQRRLVRKLWQRAVTLKMPVTAEIDENLSLTMVQTADILNLKSSKQISLPKQVYAKVQKDKMYIGKLPPIEMADEFPYAIKKNSKNK